MHMKEIALHVNEVGMQICLAQRNARCAQKGVIRSLREKLRANLAQAVGHPTLQLHHAFLVNVENIKVSWKAQSMVAKFALEASTLTKMNPASAKTAQQEHFCKHLKSLTPIQKKIIARSACWAPTIRILVEVAVLSV